MIFLLEHLYALGLFSIQEMWATSPFDLNPSCSSTTIKASFDLVQTIILLQLQLVIELENSAIFINISLFPPPILPHDSNLIRHGRYHRDADEDECDRKS